MSSVNMDVKVVDSAASGGSGKEENKKETDRRGSWKRLPWTSKSLPWNLSGASTGYTDAKVDTLLGDFLRPDAKLTETSVAASILALIPAQAAGGKEVGMFSSTCVRLAEQIPYHDPSQLKLARLLRRLGETPKFKREVSVKSEEPTYNTCQLLWEYLCDRCSIPDEEHPNMSVNLKAFTANLYASGLWGASPGFAFTDLRAVFESPAFEENEDWWRSVEVMEAAQWILWHGQTVFKFILDADDDDTLDDNPNSACRKVGKKLENAVPAVHPRSVERWRFWKDGFAAVESQSYATEECKKVAARTARLMEAIEASMLF